MRLPMNVLSQVASLRRHLFNVGCAVVLVSMALIGCIRIPSEQPVDTHQSIPHGLMPAPALGVVVDPDMKVIDIDPGSAAEKAGIQVGDVLLSVDDVPLASERDTAEDLLSESPGEAVYEKYRETGEWQGKKRPWNCGGVMRS
jgi:membrane-associated protease RseP (regulator of RpoE activity)